MNIAGFKDEVIKINNDNYGFGNDVLYSMALNPTSLSNQKVLSGALWLIGRSYAASPQRRSYGTTKTGATYKNKDGKSVVRPIWPVLTDNDGREDFFLQIADTLLVNKFDDFINDIPGINNSNSFEYIEENVFINAGINTNSKDYTALKAGILSVLKFNLALCVALETFDKVPSSNYVYEGESVLCSNHISFCSKFLHFYFPSIVYIIDSFASVGANLLFNHKRTQACFDHLRNQFFENDIYSFFNSENYNRLLCTIMADTDIQNILDIYKRKKQAKNAILEENINNEDTTGADDYIVHSVRSYMLGLFIINNDIDPINQLASGTKALKPVSRLTDAIFLNIKKPFTQKELDYRKELQRTYGITL